MGEGISCELVYLIFYNISYIYIYYMVCIFFICDM
jgi:hypothetical protein